VEARDAIYHSTCRQGQIDDLQARVAELEAAQSWRRGVVEHLSLALRDHDLEMCRNLIGQLLREADNG
jgi:uncharacterized coiled-coil protein SlyX